VKTFYGFVYFVGNVIRFGFDVSTKHVFASSVFHGEITNSFVENLSYFVRLRDEKPKETDFYSSLGDLNWLLVPPTTVSTAPIHYISGVPCNCVF
jgi:hypothetical protein